MPWTELPEQSGFGIGGKERQGHFQGLIDSLQISNGIRYSGDAFDPPAVLQHDKHTLALYHFDEGQGDVLKDSSGNNHHGKITGAKWVGVGSSSVPESGPVTDSIAAPGYALQFDGSGSIPIEGLVITPDEAITVEGYVRFEEGRRGQFTKILGSASFRGAAPMLIGVIGQIRVSKQQWSLFESKQSITTDFDHHGEWVHVAAVREGDRRRFFLNGKRIGECDVKERLELSEFQLGDEYFVGAMREVRISNVARYDRDFTPARRFRADSNTTVLYHFDEGQGDVLKDSSGNGHHGKIVGAKWVRVEPPRSEYSLDFSEPKAYVVVPDVKPDGTKPFTLETVVTLPADDHARRIILRTTQPVVVIGMYGKRNTVEVQCRDSLTGNYPVITATTPSQPGKRLHLAAVFDGRKLSVFVNGRKGGQQAEIESLGGGPGPARINLGGVTAIPPSKLTARDVEASFGGRIHRVRLSSTARYHSDFSPDYRFDADAETIALYRFDEGTGDVLKDSSGNGHHGTIVGAKWVKVDESDRQ